MLQGPQITAVNAKPEKELENAVKRCVWLGMVACSKNCFIFSIAQCYFYDKISIICAQTDIALPPVCPNNPIRANDDCSEEGKQCGYAMRVCARHNNKS